MGRLPPGQTRSLGRRRQTHTGIEDLVIPRRRRRNLLGLRERRSQRAAPGRRRCRLSGLEKGYPTCQ
jgi:hypothetical protein